MAIVVEDGTIVAGANSFVSVADCDTYHAARNNADWIALGTADKEKHLLVAAAYVCNGQIYVYDGASIVDGAHSLVWPRSGAQYAQGGSDIAETAVPVELIDAQCVAAELSRAGRLPTQLFTAFSTSQGAVRKKRIGDLEVEYYNTKGTGLADSTASIYGDALRLLGHPDVTGLLRPLLDYDFYEDLLPGSSMNRAARTAGYIVPASSYRSFRPGLFDSPLGGMDTPGETNEILTDPTAY